MCAGECYSSLFLHFAFRDGWAQVPDGWAQIVDDWAQARSGPPLATPLGLTLGS